VGQQGQFDEPVGERESGEKVIGDIDRLSRLGSRRQAGRGDVISFRRGQNCVDRPIGGAGPHLTLVGARSEFSRHDFRGELIAAFRERGTQANRRLARLIPLGVALQIPHRRGFDGREQA
jgi:hypothetical protein